MHVVAAQVLCAYLLHCQLCVNLRSGDDVKVKLEEVLALRAHMVSHAKFAKTAEVSPMLHELTTSWIANSKSHVISVRPF
jgi:hypothetical protein